MQCIQQELGAGGGSDVDAAAVGEGLGWKRLLDGELKAMVEEERLFLVNALALLEKACPQVRGGRTASRPLPAAQQCNVQCQGACMRCHV